MRRNVRRIALSVVALAGIAIGARMGLEAWFERQIGAWIEFQRAQGHDVGHAGIETGGFPHRFVATVSEPRWVVPERAALTTLEAPLAVVEFVPWRPLDVRNDQPVGATATHVPRDPARARPVASAEAATARLSFRHPGSMEKADVDITKLSLIRVKADGPRPTGTIDAVDLVGHFPDWASLKPGEITARFRIEADRVVAADGVQDLPFDGAAHASLSVAVRERLWSLALDDVVRWRDEGGTLEVEALDVDWNPIDAYATGTIALDEALRPIGASTIEMRGLDKVLDRLVASGDLDGSAANIGKLVMAVFTRPASDGGTPVVKVPLTVQDGYAKAGPLPLFPVGSIVR
jgi:hypothetical protein